MDRADRVLVRLLIKKCPKALRGTVKADRLTGSYTVSVSRRVPPNAAPTVAIAARSDASVVTATNTVLSVLGADDRGEANLKYTWATALQPAGVAGPTFSTNGVCAAKNTTVTFASAGVYRFTVTIADAEGLKATSVADVTVVQALTSVLVSPGTASVRTGASQQFTASARDQFHRDMATHAPSGDPIGRSRLR